jgi:hypothetical protein
VFGVFGNTVVEATVHVQLGQGFSFEYVRPSPEK